MVPSKATSTPRHSTTEISGTTKFSEAPYAPPYDFLAAEVSGSDQGQINGILVSNLTRRESTRNRTDVKFSGHLCQVFKQRFYLLKLFAGGQFEVGHMSNRKIQSKIQNFHWFFNENLKNRNFRKIRKVDFSIGNFQENLDFRFFDF